MIKIYIENFPFKTENEDLKAKFETYGVVAKAHIIRNKDTGISKCFGFVEMSNEVEAMAAIEGLHNAQWEDRTLTVNESKPKERKTK